MAGPALTFQVEFGALYSGTWTNITADVDMSSQGSIHFGRTDPRGTPGVATLSFRLANALGKYTPQRQVLADGVTAHPYYPNVVPDKRIQVGYTVSAVFYPRFTGFISSWVPGLENGVRAYVDITASDVTDRLSRVTLLGPMQQQIMFDGPPTAFWPLTDAAGSPQAAEASGNGFAPMAVTLTGAGTTSMLTFGSAGPGAGDGSGVNFAPTGFTDAAILGTPTTWLGSGGVLSAASAYSIEMWVQCPTAPSVGFPQMIYSYNISGPLGPFTENLELSFDGTITYNSWSGAITTGASFIGPGWHHVVTTYSGPTTTAQLYIDNVLQGTLTAGTAPAGAPGAFYVGGQYRPPGFVLTGVDFIGNVGYVAAYNATILSPTVISNHYRAGFGWAGDSTSTRIARVLGYAGLTSAQWNLDAGFAQVATYPQAGKTVLQYAQDMAVTEGGGSAFYATPDGLCRFANRYFRQPAAPVLTVDAQKDLINSSYLPSLDKVNLQNQCIVQRSGESGTLSTQVVQVAATSVVSQTLTTYATTDADALANGQQIVAQNATPGFRFPQVGLSLLTSVNALATSVAAVQIGSRIRLSAIPAGKASATQVDVMVEGWTETFTNTSYNWVADTSPADNPAAGVYDSTTYGRFAAAGTCSLTATITAAATALSITTSAGNPTFTTVSGDYPLKIRINEEVIQLNIAPGGASSPQSFTGVTRGSSGTPAAPQTAGTLLDVWPLPTFTI